MEATLEVGTGYNRAAWLEGPVWMGDWGSLIFSDIPKIARCAGLPTPAR